MLRRLKSIFLYDNFISSGRESVKSQIIEENRKFAVSWSIAHILYWSFCLVMSTMKPDYLLCRPIYAVALAASAVSLLLALFIVPRVPVLIQAVSLLVDVVFLGAGIAVAMYLAPKTIIIFASVLVVPVLFISNLLPTLILLIGNAVVFSIVGRAGMDPETYSWTLTNLIIFSTIGLVLGYFVNKTRFERYIFADSAVKLAELQTRYAYIDQMTELQNRRAFEEMNTRVREEMPGYCCLVLADINGLKQINDRIGHEAGDELITASAECLRRGFAGIDSIYRIGGDEFCVFITDEETGTARCLEQVAESCAGWKGKYVNGFSLSYGYADSKEFPDIDSIRRAADERMYQFKRQFYINNGKDRRRR